MQGRKSPLQLYQLCVSLYRPLYPMWLYPNIPLRHSGGAVLQEPLDKGNVIAILDIYISGVKLSEAVGADTLIAQVITDKGKLFLYGSCDQGKHQHIAAYAVA